MFNFILKNSRLCCFLASAEFPQKNNLWVLQGSVDALFRWGGKRLHYFVATFLRIPLTKFYHNRPSFVQDMAKTFWLTFFLGHGVYSTTRSTAEGSVWICLANNAKRWEANRLYNCARCCCWDKDDIDQRVTRHVIAIVIDITERLLARLLQLLLRWMVDGKRWHFRSQETAI